jgi:hypothetical protein
VHGRKPVAVQRRMVTGETPSRRAACCTLRYTPRNLAAAVWEVNAMQFLERRREDPPCN